jgi:hypothetical protein
MNQGLKVKVKLGMISTLGALLEIAEYAPNSRTANWLHRRFKKENNAKRRK